MRLWCGLALAVFILFSHTGLAEDTPLVASLKEAGQSLKQTQDLLRKENPEKKDRDDLLAAAREGLKQTAVTVGHLKTELQGVLDRIHGKNPPKRESDDPSFPYRMDHNTHSFLRGQILQGDVRQAAQLIELSTVNVKLVEYFYHFAQAAGAAKGIRRIPYGDYVNIRIQLQNALNTLERFFPSLPPFPMGPIDNEGKITFDETLLEGFFDFMNPSGSQPLPDGAKKMLTNMVRTIDTAAHTINFFHRAYPQKKNDEALQHLTATLTSAPGFADCVNLARGMGDFDGAPCQPRPFLNGLNTYIDFYEKLSGAAQNILSTILDFFVRFKEDEGVDADDASYRALHADMTKFVKKAAFSAAIKDKWDALSKDIFGDLRTLRNSMHEGAVFHKYMKGLVAKHGLLPREGFDDDYQENLEAAKALRQRFVQQKLDKLDESIERIGVDTSCKAFLDNDQKKDFKTINTLVSAQGDAKAEASANGYRRLVWLNEVKVGSALSIQNTQLKDVMVAGLSLHTALRLIVPNIVHTRKLLGKDVGTDLPGIGLEKNDAAGALSTVMRHYRFPEWKQVISASEEAYVDVLRGYAKEQKLEGNLAEEEFRGKIDSGMRKQFREQMNESAKRLRTLHEWRDKIRNNAAVLADPPIATILQIDTAFTGEQDKRMAAEINKSLIEVFLPTFIEEYIRRKNPDITRDDFTRAYNKLKSTFTIDQFMDQMEWYAWPDYKDGKSEARWALIQDGTHKLREPPYDGPFRKPGRFSGARVAIIGAEEFKILYRYPVLCARLLNHTMDSYQRKLDYLDHAIRKEFYSSPALQLDDAYKGYDDDKFQVTMERYLGNAVAEANKILRLKKTKDVLDYFVPNLPIMNLVLRYHPDQKLAICEEQRDRKLWDERTQLVLDGVSMAATGAAYIPVLAPVGIAVEGIVLVIEGYRAWVKYEEMKTAERILFAGGTQIDFESTEENRYLLRQMEAAYAESLAIVAVHAAMVAPAVAMKLPALRKLPGLMARSPKAFMRAFKSIAADVRAARAAAELEANIARQAIQNGERSIWFATSPTRLARVLRFLDGVRHRIMVPFVKLGVAQRWMHKTLYQRIYMNLAWRKAHKLVWNVGGLAKDVFFNLPWSVMGYSGGNGLISRAIQTYFTYEMVMWTVHAFQGVSDASTELVMDRVHQDPDTYGDLVDGMYDGEYRHSDLVLIIQIDDKLGAFYREKTHDLVTEYGKAQTREERGAVLQNLRNLEAQLVTELAAEEAKDGFDPNRVRVMRRTRRQVRESIRQIALTNR